MGNRIRKLRAIKNLSMEKLTKRAGLTKGYISRIENSTKSFPLDTLTKISTALIHPQRFL
jgi:transcriptional regulator with XRE-family HTH domain